MVSYIDNVLTVNDLSSPRRSQKVTLFASKIYKIDISPNNKFYFVAFKE